jgi:hypothetical protein
MKKATRSIVGLALAGLGIVFYLWFTPGRTPAIHGANSIASLERIRIGDVDQYILIRGNDSSLPILLFLHGGPGMPAMYLATPFSMNWRKNSLSSSGIAVLPESRIAKTLVGHSPQSNLSQTRLN